MMDPVYPYTGIRKTKDSSCSEPHNFSLIPDMPHWLYGNIYYHFSADALESWNVYDILILNFQFCITIALSLNNLHFSFFWSLLSAKVSFILQEDRIDATSLMCSMVDSIKSHPVMVCRCFLTFGICHNLFMFTDGLCSLHLYRKKKKNPLETTNAKKE